MTRLFGWDLPPGCTVKQIEDQFAGQCPECAADEVEAAFWDDVEEAGRINRKDDVALYDELDDLQDKARKEARDEGGELCAYHLRQLRGSHVEDMIDERRDDGDFD